MDPLNMMLSWRSFGSKFKDLVGSFPSGTQPVAHGFPRKWCIQIPSYLAIIPRGFHVDGVEQNCTLAFLVSYFGSSTLPCISGLIIGWWQLKYFWNFHPYIGKKTNLTHIFQMGCNHQLDKESIQFFLKGTILTFTFHCDRARGLPKSYSKKP